MESWFSVKTFHRTKFKAGNISNEDAKLVTGLPLSSKSSQHVRLTLAKADLLIEPVQVYWPISRLESVSKFE